MRKPSLSRHVRNTFEAYGYQVKPLKHLAESFLEPEGRWADLLVSHADTLDTWLVRVQLGKTGPKNWRHAIARCAATRDLFGADFAVLVLDRPIERPTFWNENLAIWGRDDVISATREIFEPDALPPTESVSESRPAIQVSPNVQLVQWLRSLPCGKTAAADYERLTLEAINYLFRPYLQVFGVQMESEDGLDRRDLLFKVKSGHKFWDAMRDDYRLRILVVECKNYCEPIGQSEIESLQQYLWPQAFRSVGLLCSRQRPSRSAIIARRRAWVEFGKLILFVSDSELLEMLQPFRIDITPTSILDAQLDDFFGSITP